MLFANDSDKNKIGPSPNAKGICPGCKNEVFAKCGDINIWHWSHHKDESCDSFSEPETYWHRRWKEIFGKESTEIIIQKNGKWHFADILTKRGIVIELQNSPLKFDSIKEREEFYGEKMLWVLNGERFGNHYSIENVGYFPSPSPFYQPNLMQEWAGNKSIKSTSIDFNGKSCGTQTTDLLNASGFTYSPTRKLFYKQGGISPENYPAILNALLDLSKKVNQSLDIFGKEYEFQKGWPTRSWKIAKRPIFIDYNVGVLMRITSGMGGKVGTAKFYRTEEFINKYTKDL